MERARQLHDDADRLGIKSLWHLENAKQKMLDHPASFDRPNRGALRALRRGHHAKVCFLHVLEADGSKQPSERLWLRVTKKLSGGRFCGTVANDPVFIFGLNYGDPVDFHADNVYDLRLDYEPVRRDMEVVPVCDKCSHPECNAEHSPLPTTTQ